VVLVSTEPERERSEPEHLAASADMATARAAHAHAPSTIFCDLETDGLAYPWLDMGRRIWEIGAIVRKAGKPDSEHHAFIALADLEFDPVTPGHSRRTSPDIGGFYERHPQLSRNHDPRTSADVLTYAQATQMLVALFDDETTFVGAVPSFDAESILHLLATNSAPLPENQIAPWRPRLVCVWSLIAGRFAIPAKALDRRLACELLHLDPDSYTHHSALDDCRWARDAYDALISEPQ
jgi:hypothetical protein